MVLSRALAFLQQQKFEKQCTFVPVLPALEKLVKDSPFLTVVLVSAGEQKIQGTPFDDPNQHALCLVGERATESRMAAASQFCARKLGSTPIFRERRAMASRN